jgi:hypothetical protein
MRLPRARHRMHARLLPPLRGKDGMGGEVGVFPGENTAVTPTSLSAPQGGGVSYSSAHEQS